MSNMLCLLKIVRLQLVHQRERESSIWFVVFFIMPQEEADFFKSRRIWVQFLFFLPSLSFHILLVLILCCMDTVLLAKSLQSCLTLCDPVDNSPPSSSVHGILQARILEWVVTLFSRGSSPSRDLTCISCLLHWQMGSLPLAPPGKSHWHCITE